MTNSTLKIAQTALHMRSCAIQVFGTRVHVSGVGCQDWVVTWSMRDAAYACVPSFPNAAGKYEVKEPRKSWEVKRPWHEAGPLDLDEEVVNNKHSLCRGARSAWGGRNRGWAPRG